MIFLNCQELFFEAIDLQNHILVVIFILLQLRRTNINRIPLYKQIYEYMLENIKSGTWHADKPIPSENEISRQFKVSRITIKQAFDMLVEKGIVYRIQGRGTFISIDQSGEPVLFRAGNFNATSQAPRVGRFIGYIAPRLNNMFMANMLSSIESAAAEAGFRLLFAQTHDSQGMEEQVLAEFEKLGASGLLVYPVEGELYNEAFLKLILRRYPLVLIDRYLRGVETDSVCSDNLAAGRQATEHLLELGHRRIGFVSHVHHGTSSVEDRLQGYESALQDAGIPVDNQLRLLTLKTLNETNKEEIRNFLKSHPDLTAIIAVNSSIGRQILESAAELGRRIPEDISLVLFDNREPLPVFPTYIKQQESEIARAAVRLLVEAIADPAHRRTKVVLPTTLVQGKTSRPPRE